MANKYKPSSYYFESLLKHYIELNVNYNYDKFFGSVLDDDNLMNKRLNKERELEFNDNYRSFDGVDRFPLFINQIGVLFAIDNTKYDGFLNDKFLNLIGSKYRKNNVFIVNKQGKLLSVMLMQIGKEDKKTINYFFQDNINELHHYQYLSTDYDPKLDPFKLLTAETSRTQKLQDAILDFN